LQKGEAKSTSEPFLKREGGKTKICFKPAKKRGRGVHGTRSMRPRWVCKGKKSKMT